MTNFLSVEKYFRNVSLEEILSEQITKHLQETRLERVIETYKILSDGDRVFYTFLVDKGHTDGKELHCVTRNGIILILNVGKFVRKEHSLITILIARPNQVQRLFDSCNMYTPKSVINKCIEHQRLRLNYI